MAEPFSNPGWHLYQFDFAAGMSEWLMLSEAQFRGASFLDQRILGNGPPPDSVPLAELRNMPDGQTAALANFIFHIGHCGSTLISRALAATPAVLPVREPLTLRQLSKLNGGMPSNEWLQFLQFALAAHSRQFSHGQTSMIKATSTCNALIRPISELMPDSRMLLLYVRLESYLAGMLGKQTPALDLAGHATLRLQEWLDITGQVLVQPAGELDEAQLAVLAWLTSMARLLEADKLNDQQCLLLDFDEFLAAPETGLSRLVEFFLLEESGPRIRQAWPEISVGYSKQPDQPYSAFNRTRTLARGRLQRGAEIQSGLDWAKDLIAQHPALQSCSDYF